MGEPGDITRLLRDWKEGQPGAFEQLMPVVYADLKRIALGYLRHERPDHTLQATGLVHELYLRLCQQRETDWNDRAHFYTFAAKVMRMILIDHAREAKAEMRGGCCERIPLSDALAWVDIGSPELLDLNRALDELGALDPEKVQLVELRCFLGCTAEETAALMQGSKSSVDRDLKFVKSWLYRRIRPGVAAGAVEA
jgi:RNA polymerase sigma factor (TIGR02999 family)